MNLESIKTSIGKNTPQPLKPYKYYGIMVPLIKQGDKFSLLFEVRSDELITQPGEVCFPGGGKEDGESPQECAVRETCEELCISPEKIEVIGALDYLNAYSNFTLYPFVGVIDYEDVKNIPFNQNEVQETFLVPLDFFLENEPLTFTFPVIPTIPNDFNYALINHEEPYTWRTGKVIIPIYNYGSHTIWGLTARVVHNLTKLLREEV